ncbi:unnamed protein product [Durusdinium trenchii]|uniref:Ubiquitin-like domain-containing protein n=1 Tax=Durusdinium trenchii TaxID=1381693 RepID=A0ABP0NYW8_9DINO
MAACTTVDVLVRALGGEGTPVTLRRGAAVSEAKRILEDVLGIPTLEQRLLLGTSILDDEAEPFLDMAPLTELQVLRQPRLTLEQFRQELGHGETPFELNLLLAEAVRLEEPTVALEIVDHPNFAEGEMTIEEQGKLLKILAVSGFAAAFEGLVQHERVGRRPGVLDKGFEALHHAASRGLLLHCQSLLNSPDFHAAGLRKQGNTTPLHHAANEKVLETLLTCPDLRTDKVLNARDRYSCTCLHYASSPGACQMILSQPEFHSINAQDIGGRTALHCANSPGVAEEILRHPSFDSLSVTDSLGRSALHLLCRSEAIAEVLLSVEMPQEVLDLLDKRGRSALHFAASEAVCRRLFAKGFSQVNALDSMKRSALHNARDAGVAKAILEHPDFDQLNARSEPGHETALAYAAAIRDDAMVRELLRHPGHEVESLQAALEFSFQLQPETQALLEEKLKGEPQPTHICQIL